MSIEAPGAPAAVSREVPWQNAGCAAVCPVSRGLTKRMRQLAVGLWKAPKRCMPEAEAGLKGSRCAAVFRSGERQAHLEAGAAAFARQVPDGAAMLLRDLTYER